MKNTWLHSITLIALATCLIAVTMGSRSYAAGFFLAAPIDACSMLGPGLLLGWFTRRHPLLVGAIAGAMGIIIAHQFFTHELRSPSLLEESIATAMTVAVAAFAGRALRFRIQPDQSFKAGAS